MNAALASHAASPNDSLCSAALLFPSNTSCLNIRLIEVSIKSGQLQILARVRAGLLTSSHTANELVNYCRPIFEPIDDAS
jgi:hypothetical protein